MPWRICWGYPRDGGPLHAATHSRTNSHSSDVSPALLLCLPADETSSGVTWAGAATVQCSLTNLHPRLHQKMHVDAGGPVGQQGAQTDQKVLLLWFAGQHGNVLHQGCQQGSLQSRPAGTSKRCSPGYSSDQSRHSMDKQPTQAQRRLSTTRRL